MSVEGIALEDEVYKRLIGICIFVLKEKKQLFVTDILKKMMDDEGVPIHYPYHHFIVPASLMTAVALQTNMESSELEEKLVLVWERSKSVPGGACGDMGACGAGVGAGIFLSVYTDTTPMSKVTWQWVNEMTGRCLQKISSVEGPRCCKRTAFLAVQEAVVCIEEKLAISLKLPEQIVCNYHEENLQCKREVCPFYHIG